MTTQVEWDSAIAELQRHADWDAAEQQRVKAELISLRTKAFALYGKVIGLPYDEAIAAIMEALKNE